MFDSIDYFLIKFCSYCNLDCSYCIIDDKESKDFLNFFDQADGLLKLAKTLPIGNKLDIELTGGEVGFYPDKISKFIKTMKKLERYKDTTVTVSLVTNGSNLYDTLKLCDDGIIDPWSMKLSWDGLYSCSKVRHTKNPYYTDEFFKDRIRMLGKSRYNKDVLVRIALTKDTIDDLADSFKFALDAGCNKIEYYYLYLKDNPDYYRDEEFIKKIEDQLYKIADLYRETPFDYENWNYLYYTEYLEPNKKHLFDLSCEIIGRMLYFTIDGRIFPCGLFSDNFFGRNDFQIGTIQDGLDKNAMIDFIKEYSTYEQCTASMCGNYHCYKCPAFLYYRDHTAEYPDYDFCRLRSLEKKIFLEKAPKEYDHNKIKYRMDFTRKGPLSLDIPSWFRM